MGICRQSGQNGQKSAGKVTRDGPIWTKIDAWRCSCLTIMQISVHLEGEVEQENGVTFLEQHCSGITRDVVLQIGASCQPVGQIHRALLPAVEVPLCPAVKPGRDRQIMRRGPGGCWNEATWRWRHSLHDEDVDCVHEDQDERLPPAHKHTGQRNQGEAQMEKMCKRQNISVHTSTPSRRRWTTKGGQRGHKRT